MSQSSPFGTGSGAALTRPDQPNFQPKPCPAPNVHFIGPLPSRPFSTTWRIGSTVVPNP